MSELEKIAICPCGSKKTFIECHGNNILVPTGELKLAKSTRLIKLDLACGQKPINDFEGVDAYAPDVTHKVDLLKFPWKWEDSSVDELHCSHFIEHIPLREVEERDLSVDNPMNRGKYVGKDMLFAFFDECYRVLKPGCPMKIVWPALQSVRAFQDPTHRRFIPSETFAYFSTEWRKANQLDHYNIMCDFSTQLAHSCQEEFNKMHPEAAARRFREGWNTIFDFHASMVSKKPKE
jgi:hypothetical protein